MTVTGQIEQALQALREAGAAQRDPVRWHYIEVLQRRTLTQPEAVQRLLHERLLRALQDLASAQTAPPAARGAAQTVAKTVANTVPNTAANTAANTVANTAAPSAAAARPASATTPARTADRSGAAPASAAKPAPSALGRLLQDLQALQTSTPAPQTLRPGRRRGSRLPPENPRVRQFRQQLQTISVNKQVQQALAQAPQNAGPINSQRLVLRALALMRDISPDYLQRFMTHVDTLLCLESAQPSRSPAVRKKPSRA